MRIDQPIENDSGAREEAVWRLATALAGSATAFEVAEALAREGAAAAGGYLANMAVLEEGGSVVHIVHRSALEPQHPPRWSRFDLDESVPACEAIRSGLAVLLHSPEEILERYPHPDLLAEMQTAGLSARASLPLPAPGRAAG